MNFTTLKNTDLISNFENLVRNERRITAQVLECLVEIDRRKLYEVKGFTSLFDFLVKDVGYSPGAAMRRVDGARLLRELPEVSEKFKNGSLTLSQANQIQRASRELKKVKNEELSTESKRDLVFQIENATQKQTEQIMATTLDLPFVPQHKETFHRDQSVTLTITFTQEQMQILEQAQNMISHSLASQGWAEAIAHLAKREVSRRTTVRKNSANNHATRSMDSKDSRELPAANVVAAVKSEIPNREDSKPTQANVKRQRRPAVPAVLRKQLLVASARCSYRNESGRRCESQKFLQIDHVHSWSRGGTHAPENLQVLCGMHNRLKYVQEKKFRVQRLERE